MPMAISRRRLLMAAAGLSLAATPTAWAQSADDIVLAWDDPTGAHWVGVLRIEGDAATVRHRIAVPTRAHGLLSLADGAVIAIARRPGDWMLRWTPDTDTPPRWFWADDERRFNGHALASPDGNALFCTEADADSGAGFLVRRDARTLAATDAWPTGGTDPHDIEALEGGRILVANGGVATRPETGRTKIDLAAMDSSLVCIDAATGRTLQSWRLADRRLSLRHLARRADGSIGVAMQAEHDDPTERASAPMLALLDAGLRTLQTTAIRGSGYAGDIVATSQGWAVACPRDSRVMLCSAEGKLIEAVPLNEGCALAEASSGTMAFGRDGVWDEHAGRARLPPGLQPDNHAVRYRG
jgi:uncharacterized protein